MRRGPLGLAAALAAALAIFGGLHVSSGQAAPGATAARTTSAAGCNLANGIKHVIYLQFDNTHLLPDRPPFASDLELMPNLLNLLTTFGTVSDNHHTVLISHTSNGILTSLTGMYPDRHGVTVGNSYRYFRQDGSTASTGAFKYWTDLVDDTNNPPTDPLPNMVNGDSGSPKITPAPWVPYTRAGCDFGAVSLANIELENTGIGLKGDMTNVFGAGSPEWLEAQANPSLAQTDFVGIAIHCAQGGGICTGNANAKADSLPDEPGGYNGYLGLFGAKYVDPAINNGSASVNNMFGQPVTDPLGRPGFPGFDGAHAANSLGYILQMQKMGIPVTFAYISDAHDQHIPSGSSFANQAFGPGEAGYVQVLHEYDQAFGLFFRQAFGAGLTPANTLLVVTADENDHLAGGNSPNGVWSHTHCNVTAAQQCPSNQIGEVNLNLNSVLPLGEPAYAVHSDSAPTVYVTGHPVRTDATVRKFERDVGAANAVDPYVSTNPTPLTLALADPVEEQTLHMVNADPNRTPTFTLFANPDYFVSTFNTNCPDAAHSVPDCIDYHFAWSHGDVTEDIARTWFGILGPGVRHMGQTSSIWSDHSDLQPTMLSLLGLQDDYAPDGRVLTEALSSSVFPRSLAASDPAYTILSQTYKQLLAPFGSFGLNTLASSTLGLKSGTPADDSTYNTIESQISGLTSQRDSVAGQIRLILNNTAFNGIPINIPAALPLDVQAQTQRAAAAALPH
jgi:hypothetical protein